MIVLLMRCAVVLTCILQILESSSSDSLLPSNSMMPLIRSQYWAWSMFPVTNDYLMTFILVHFWRDIACFVTFQGYW